MEKKHAVIDNAAEKRYELDLGKGDMALIEYATGDGFVVLTHTEVSARIRGSGHRQGIGVGRLGGHPQQGVAGRAAVFVRRGLHPAPSRMGGPGADRGIGKALTNA